MLEIKSAASLLTGVAAASSAIIGVYIGYQAYRGLRRNDEPAMRYLSAGMVILFGVTYLVAVVGQGLLSFFYLTITYQWVFRLVVRLLQLAGLSLIAYSLHIATNSHPQG
ncbi:hypothetical protein C440_06737 [Haloferax mucosum ATCC BAA-1512]|uniref:Uncharacterized protein n=1 Tax=Haloferax mucosum ATCC BAA-1512 TaxID=662479 RepID=M0IGS9_9EURY|nr:hypothetical protein [Haloferax mucosum]ELZ95966.1 hypothetical protein C440_06737 [Haloferax mucosum ATCC BAA-1512]